MIITIDGPAGSGKSTAARKLAEALGIPYLDTGATYRAVTLLALQRGVDLTDEKALEQLARSAEIRLENSPDGLRVILNGRDVTEQIRSPEVSDNSHYVASCPAVRQVLVELQRSLGSQLGDFVSEGRDQGSVVFPQADIKFYLTASVKERAARRCQQLAESGHDVQPDHVLRAIEQRDRRDRTRPIAPLVKPDGAIVIDTTNNTIEQTAAELLRHVENRR